MMWSVLSILQYSGMIPPLVFNDASLLASCDSSSHSPPIQ
jgi:hypothetical protein